MGEVYRAKDTRLGRTVAIKVLNKEHMQRFEREARAIAALSHPNICTLHDVGPDYLVMEYVDGAAIKGPLPVQEAVRLAIQIASALDEAHRRGILHRDLKPGNIMVTRSGAVKLLDFGLAKLATGAESDTASTIEGTVMGTPAYMSPEQAQGKPVDERSDIFSFGLVLYEMLSGRRAFSGDNSLAILSAIQKSEPLPLQTSFSLEKIVRRCLAKQPSARYQAISEVKTALEAVSREMEAKSSAEPQPSIAVLPFVNMSGDKEQEYFSDGLAEEIINALAQIPRLKVIARTSAFAFRGKEQDITKIAEALRVRTILEGSVRRSGNRIRITTQLIDASDGSHLWSERYDREMTDVFAIQDEISQAIAEKLRVRLSGDRPLVKRHTANIEAYNLYLIGRHHFYKLTPEGLAKGKEYFEKSIELDANCAPAWVGLAEADWYQGFLGFMRPKIANATARQSTLKALELDETLPEAHAMMAVLSVSEFDWKGAEREFHRAQQLGNESPFVWSSYSAFYLVPMGRLDEAIVAARKALELDPLSPIMQWQLGHRYFLMGQYDRSIEQCRNVLELDPQAYQAPMLIGLCYIRTKRSDEGIQACERAVKLGGREPVQLCNLGWAYAVTGRITEAKKILDELHELAEKAYVPPYAFLSIYFGLGEMDIAFNWLEKVVDERDGMICNVPGWSYFDPLRSHPRYHALLRKMNLEPFTGQSS
jgi:serine/threonine-protein kinase